MLDGLRRANQAGIERRAALIVLDDLAAFLGNADDGVAGLGHRLLADDGEHALQALHVAFSFLEVALKGLLKLRVLRRLGHLG